MSSFSENSYRVGGVPEGYDAKVLADFLRDRSCPVVHVARDDSRMAATATALEFFAPDIPILQFPAWDCLPYDRVSPNAEVSATRMATLATLAGGFDAPFILLTTIGAASQMVPTRDVIKNASFTATVGRQINEKDLRSYFQKMGFTQAPTVMEPGDYAIRGGLIDVYSPGDSGPVRMDLFGDVLDGAKRFEVDTQRTTEKLDRVELAPVSEVLMEEAAIQRFRQNYRVEFGAAGTDDPLYEAVSAGLKHQGVEHWMPYFHESLETIFDYIKDAIVCLDDKVPETHQARWETISEQYDARKETLTNKARLDSVYKPCAPQLMYLDEAQFDLALSDFEIRHFAVLPQAPGLNSIDMGGRIGRNFAPERQQEEISLFGALGDHVTETRKSGHVVIASYSEGARERLSGMLADQDISAVSNLRNWTGQTTKAGQLSLAVWPLEHGFQAPGITVISEQDVMGDRLIRKVRKKRKADNYLTEARSLSPGDLVVHLDHGIGRYTGLETITAARAPHECLALEYANKDRLFLPVENIELLSRYGHDDGMLDRLGGGAWQAKKANLKERIREMADKLICIAAERALRKAEILEPPQDTWDKFCSRFPYTETDDQLNAIEDVMQDMASGRPMDRLVCGDVGFGKTEVALRAAFIAASSGVQVAIVCPTTLLARQHFKSFEDRFRGMGVRVKQLSRFVSTKEANATREALAEGALEIVVGTHAILSKQVKFANLGLLVIDEEQHFGVGHKEQLKQLRSDVHVLTLTATPIPRTLQLSLSGVRELSLIGTPPVDRLAIRTYVSSFDTVTLREALLREHYRGGQSFYVVPRISDFPDIEEFLKDQLPELTYIIANGQMPAGELDDKMNAFYDGKYDVLLATTIVESGLDIPTANTMIVHRADMFGLAQLYQIRGRVGRSKTRAYAYLTTKPRQRLTPAAEKRLRVLGSLDSLGAGFTLASQDLDIRGAGNLLGEEQTGNVREVGYELYQEMLEEAIAKMKAGTMEGLSDADDGGWSPQINLGVAVLIPSNYVPDLDVRLGLYRRLSSLATKIELEGFAAELIDRFGKLPEEVDTLLRIVRVKGMCRRAGIAKLDGGPKGAVFQFYKDKFKSPVGLVEYINKNNGLAKIRDNKLVVRRDWATDDAKVKGAYIIARDLAVLANPKKK